MQNVKKTPTIKHCYKTILIQMWAMTTSCLLAPNEFTKKKAAKFAEEAELTIRELSL